MWKDEPTTYGPLGHRDQVYLHDYFLPSLSMTQDDLLRYRKKISADQPSLPQCAGRAEETAGSNRSGAAQAGVDCSGGGSTID